nr:vegetative cell wall protein gp1-like [Penaeus vannamei]
MKALIETLQEFSIKLRGLMKSLPATVSSFNLRADKETQAITVLLLMTLENESASPSPPVHSKSIPSPFQVHSKSIPFQVHSFQDKSSKSIQNPSPNSKSQVQVHPSNPSPFQVHPSPFQVHSKSQPSPFQKPIPSPFKPIQASPFQSIPSPFQVIPSPSPFQVPFKPIPSPFQAIPSPFQASPFQVPKFKSIPQSKSIPKTSPNSSPFQVPSPFQAHSKSHSNALQVQRPIPSPFQVHSNSKPFQVHSKSIPIPVHFPTSPPIPSPHSKKNTRREIYFQGISGGFFPVVKKASRYSLEINLKSHDFILDASVEENRDN